MAVNFWVGGAPPVAQVSGFTIGGTINGVSTVGITINNKTVSVVTDAAGSATTTAANLATALNASLTPEFQEETWASAAAIIYGTADIPGKPFTITSAVTGGATMVAITGASAVAAVASSGPADWSIPSNWSLNAVPVSTNDVYIQEYSGDILYGLNQAAVVLNSLTITASFTGRLGLAAVNRDAGNNSYGEYRPQYLQIQSPTVTIGQGNGNASPRIKHDAGSGTATVWYIYASGNSTDASGNIEAVLLKGTNASNSLTIVSGSCGVAVLPGETANLSGGLNIESLQGQDADPQVRCMTGVTLPSTITQDGGTLTTWSNLGTVNHYGGTHKVMAGTLTTLYLETGTVVYASTGTITTAYVSGGRTGQGTLDFSQDPRARTVTTFHLYAGGAVLDPFGTVTWTNGINVKQVELALSGDVTASLGFNKLITIANAASP